MKYTFDNLVDTKGKNIEIDPEPEQEEELMWISYAGYKAGKRLKQLLGNEHGYSRKACNHPG